jgi:hypothetical protein|tara:strand:+ start:808 stop:1062 length:255 start_codon:yes stop_codon:yes gene_type:complete
MMSMAKSARYEMYRLLRKVRDLEKSDPAYQNSRVKNLKNDIRQFQRDLRAISRGDGEATWPPEIFEMYSQIYETAKRLRISLDD